MQSQQKCSFEGGRRRAGRASARVAFEGALALALIWALGARAARAADYLVSANGNDGASGLAAAPWRTLQRAWSGGTLRAGDTVTVEDGGYSGFGCDGISGTAAAPILIRARNPLGAKITSPSADSTQDYIQLNSCSYITVDGFDVSGAPRSGIAILGNQDDGRDARGVTIQNCYSHQNGGSVVAGRHDGIFSGFALDLTLQDNHIDGTGEHGIYVSNAADNPAILRNLVENTGANGIQINADLSTGGDGLISNWRIEGNVVRNVRGPAAFNLDGAINGIARNNVIYNAAKGGITLFQGDGAEASHGNVVVNNTVYDPTGSRSAIQVADGANDNIIFNNILFAPQSVGMEIQTVTGLIHDYNLVSSYSGGAAGAHESNPVPATLFVGAATGDLRLAAGAVAVDHGVATMAGVMAPAIDLLGAARPAGTAIDIGAYELGGVTLPGTGGVPGGGTGGATGAGGAPVAGTGGHAGMADAGANDGDRTAGPSSGGCNCRSAPPGSGVLQSMLTALALGTCACRRRRRRDQRLQGKRADQLQSQMPGRP